MKRWIFLSAALLMTTNVARADHISVYSDESGTSCALGPAGFSQSATVMHKFTVGAMGARFRLEFPAGSAFFSLATPFPILGSVQSNGFVHYGECRQGSIVVGKIAAIYAPGVVWLRPADGYSSVIALDCASGENDATCGGGIVGSAPNPDYYCPSCQTVATDQKTWGKVKSLYR